MEKISLEEVNNMSEPALRQTLRDIVIERQRQEQAEAERKSAEEASRIKEEERLDGFFARKMRNNGPRFGDQY